jgi:ABC-2 type transport system ATP-binding protein
MTVSQLLSFFGDFYENFNREKACAMLDALGIKSEDRLKSMSKGTKEKVQLILVMARDAALYLLDEPIGGVDPARATTFWTRLSAAITRLRRRHQHAPDFRRRTRARRRDFHQPGQVVLQSSVDEIREQKGKSVDALFREVFRC